MKRLSRAATEETDLSCSAEGSSLTEDGLHLRDELCPSMHHLLPLLVVQAHSSLQSGAKGQNGCLAVDFSAACLQKIGCSAHHSSSGKGLNIGWVHAFAVFPFPSIQRPHKSRLANRKAQAELPLHEL